MADPGSSETSWDHGPLVAGYETLRDAVLCGRPEGWRFGHAVLARHGMAAWMATWAPEAAPAAGATAPPLSNPSTPTSSSPHPTALSSLRNAGEIVAVLAQMTLAHL